MKRKPAQPPLILLSENNNRLFIVELPDFFKTLKIDNINLSFWAEPLSLFPSVYPLKTIIVLPVRSRP